MTFIPSGLISDIY